MLQIGGVVVILTAGGGVYKAEAGLAFDLVDRSVVTVSALSVGREILYGGYGVFACQLLYIVLDAVFIAELLGFKLAFFGFKIEDKLEARVYNRLSFEDISEKLSRYIYIGKDL